MSTEILESSELVTVDASNAGSVFQKDAICKDANGNMVLFCEEASSNGINCSQGYLQAYTSLALDTFRGPKFYCFQCQYSLNTLLSMTTHMKMHLKPFCPICFQIFAHESEVNAHTAGIHPTLFSNADLNPYARSGEEDPCFTTEAPPNSPTNEYQGRMDLQTGFRDLNNRSIPFLVAQKLRKHQEKLNRTLRSATQKLKARRAVSVDGTEFLGAAQARNTIGKARLARKMHKITKPKQSTSTVTKGGEESADNSLRRLTSRFGRVINLKVPQF
ncbi:uncharacterized protein LOC126565242 [Anopheles maculipalpis]|uniref:uncharacterized protein LOC126565242 n=1 Tax=Anopheles maculipalpis TaxID=1496333 RepID=UPI0021598A58|nr:uncharacterized protein LOC126565242 [Anopheles maculipalpis]